MGNHDKKKKKLKGTYTIKIDGLSSFTGATDVEMGNSLTVCFNQSDGLFKASAGRIYEIDEEKSEPE